MRKSTHLKTPSCEHSLVDIYEMPTLLLDLLDLVMEGKHLFLKLRYTQSLALRCTGD